MEWGRDTSFYKEDSLQRKQQVSTQGLTVIPGCDTSPDHRGRALVGGGAQCMQLLQGEVSTGGPAPLIWKCGFLQCASMQGKGARKPLGLCKVQGAGSSRTPTFTNNFLPASSEGRNDETLQTNVTMCTEAGAGPVRIPKHPRELCSPCP